MTTTRGLRRSSRTDKSSEPLAETNTNVDRGNHPRLHKVVANTVISFSQFGSQVGAIVTSVEPSSRTTSGGEDIKILKLKPNGGVILNENYIYSDYPFEILKLGQDPQGKIKQTKSAKTNKTSSTTVPNVTEIKAGDRVLSDKYGDNVILVVTESKITSKKSNKGQWKGQKIADLIVQPENPAVSDVPVGTTISTGDESTIWFEHGDPLERNNSIHDTAKKDSQHVRLDELEAVPKDVPSADEKHEDAMTGYPSDYLALRYAVNSLTDKGKPTDWWLRKDLEIRSSRQECLNSHIHIQPTVDTPTLKGDVPLYPTDPDYEKEKDRREYYHLTVEGAGDLFKGSEGSCLFLLNVASVGNRNTDNLSAHTTASFSFRVSF